jgi:hypothetical protein
MPPAFERAPSKSASLIHGIAGKSPVENRMTKLAAIVAVIYLLGYALAVYYRIAISDWLTAHLPL